MLIKSLCYTFTFNPSILPHAAPGLYALRFGQHSGQFIPQGLIYPRIAPHPGTLAAG